MWSVKTFSSFESYSGWLDRMSHKVQWQRVFVNNAPYAVEYRRLRRVH